MTHDNDIFPNDEEDIIWVSKNELKRDAETLKQLGLELTHLAPHILDRLPLDESLRDAINLAKRINREGRRRQLQLIGKLLRARDCAPITQALDIFKNRDNKQTMALQKLEKWRDKLVEEGDEALTQFIQTHPNADRQHLRTLIRQAKKEKAENKPLKANRQIFHYLRDLETGFK